MCGISGFCLKNYSNIDFESVLKRISIPLKERGPDNFGYWTDNKKIGFAHQRLAIIDLSRNGNQPMMSKSKNLIISYNGEVYNSSIIRKDLIAHGISFRGTSDTEVLLEACDFWGIEKTVSKIVGMFAFAIWDFNKKKLFLVRDRIGEKPLYWSVQDKNIFFASQIKSIIAHPLFTKKINRKIMSSFLYYGNVGSGPSIFEDIHQLSPGNILEIDDQCNLKFIQYWDIINKAKESFVNLDYYSDYESTKIKIHDLISHSVKNCMISDVPIGCFLSGGIDSSLITCLMQKHSLNKIDTFSIGFDNSEYDESKFAKNISKFIGTNHNELIFNSSDVLKLIPNLPMIYDEPFGDSSQLPSIILSQFTKQKVKVALSGDGGDELFAGYNRYVWSKRLEYLVKKTPLYLRKFLSELLEIISAKNYNFLSKKIIYNKFRPKMLGDKIYKVSSILRSKETEEIYNKLITFWPNDCELVNGISNISHDFINKNLNVFNDDILLKMQIMDLLTYLPNDILTKVDRASMYSGLEVRVPFLDHNIVEYALGLPIKFKLENNNSKKILKDILGEYIPKKHFIRPKMGFAIPLDEWLRGPLKDWAETLLEKKSLEKDELFNSSPIIKRWNEHKKGQRNWQYSLWNVLMAQSWRYYWNV